MIYLHKILPIFLLPVGFTLLLIAVGVVFKKRWVVVLAFGVLYFASTPVLSRFAMKGLDGAWERSLPSDAPVADAIVVLSGGRSVAPGKAKVSEWADADRFFGGIELYQAGKAPLLVFTGGWAPWEPEAPLEGDVLIGFAKMMGVPVDAVLTTGPVLNTEDEANAVAGLLASKNFGKPSKILLVTSAFHLERAMRQFENAGMQVVPYPVDFLVSPQTEVSVIDFFPTATALRQTEFALREFYGRAYYRFIQEARSKKK